MTRFNKKQRHKDKQSGKAAVAYFNARNNSVYISGNIKVNMTGRNANNTVPITPVTPPQKPTPPVVVANTATKAIATPVPDKRKRRITPIGWAAIFGGAVLAGIAVISANKQHLGKS